MASDEEPVRVLVVDDDPSICRALEVALQTKGYDPRVTHTAGAALRLLGEWTPDLCIIDVRLPDVDGVALLEQVRRHPSTSLVPVILLTALRTDLSSKVHGLNAGANDYVVKPFSMEELMARVGANVRVARLTRRLEELTSRLADAASRDSLTGLFHHGKIMERLGIEIQRAGSHGAPLACLMLDLDRFKHVNDTFGHPAGDQVIVHVAHCLKNGCRRGDAVGRYGGDEFLVVLPGADLEGGRRKGEELLEELAHLAIPSLPPHIRVRASIGVACTDGLFLDARELVSRADQALYRAKSEGGNRVMCWPS